MHDHVAWCAEQHDDVEAGEERDHVLLASSEEEDVSAIGIEQARDGYLVPAQRAVGLRQGPAVFGVDGPLRTITAPLA